MTYFILTSSIPLCTPPSHERVVVSRVSLSNVALSTLYKYVEPSTCQIVGALSNVPALAESEPLLRLKGNSAVDDTWYGIGKTVPLSTVDVTPNLPY